jgi:hypothetical protein
MKVKPSGTSEAWRACTEPAREARITYYVRLAADGLPPFERYGRRVAGRRSGSSHLCRSTRTIYIINFGIFVNL